MNPESVVSELGRNEEVFRGLLEDLPRAARLWRSAPGKWNLHEVACHLYDEEREDFRARVRHSLESPGRPLTPIDPEGWVQARGYADWDYGETLANFLAERRASIAWLDTVVGLEEARWLRTFEHPQLGPMSAWLFLCNWLAHDYLHFRQIAQLRFGFLGEASGADLEYSGGWPS